MASAREGLLRGEPALVAAWASGDGPASGDEAEALCSLTRGDDATAFIVSFVDQRIGGLRLACGETVAELLAEAESRRDDPLPFIVEPPQ